MAASVLEVVLSSDAGGSLWNCNVWEPRSGTSLTSYRGGNTSARGLCTLAGEYLLGAQLGKNYISVWELQRKDQLQQKIICPGLVTCLAASPNGLHVAAGIGESIYLWEVSTGNLLLTLNRHYQDLTCICFTDDSSHLISGGKDNLVLVWSLCSVLQVNFAHVPEPRYVWSRHTLPVTDIHRGVGGPLSRVATASLDQTVKVQGRSSAEHSHLQSVPARREFSLTKVGYKNSTCNNSTCCFKTASIITFHMTSSECVVYDSKVKWLQNCFALVINQYAPRGLFEDVTGFFFIYYQIASV